MSIFKKSDQYQGRLLNKFFDTRAIVNTCVSIDQLKVARTYLHLLIDKCDFCDLLDLKWANKLIKNKLRKLKGRA